MEIDTGSRHIKKLVRDACIIIIFCLFAAFGHSDSDPLTQEERAWLNEHDGQIILAAEPGWPPISFFDKNGAPKGISVDYIRLIEHRLGVRFKVEKMSSWQMILDKAQRNQIDIVMNIMPTQERAQYLNFTKHYLKIPTVILTRNNLAETLTLADMAGKSSNEAMICYLSMWGIFTLFMFIGTLKLTRALQFVFGSLTILFFMLAIGDATGNEVFKHITGYEGIICGASAVYTGIAQVLNEVYGRTVMPLGNPTQK